MKGYIEISDTKYKVGKTYRIRDEETRIDLGNTFVGGFYCIFETATKCRAYSSYRKMGSRIAEVKAEIFYYEYDKNNGDLEYCLATDVAIKRFVYPRHPK